MRTGDRLFISLVVGLIAGASPTLAQVALNPHITMPGYGICDGWPASGTGP